MSKQARLPSVVATHEQLGILAEIAGAFTQLMHRSVAEGFMAGPLHRAMDKLEATLPEDVIAQLDTYRNSSSKNHFWIFDQPQHYKGFIEDSLAIIANDIDLRKVETFNELAIALEASSLTMNAVVKANTSVTTDPTWRVSNYGPSAD